MNMQGTATLQQARVHCGALDRKNPVWNPSIRTIHDIHSYTCTYNCLTRCVGNKVTLTVHAETLNSD